MNIKEDWKDTGSIFGDDKDTHHIHIRRCDPLSCNALPAKTTFLYPTTIAKSNCENNPLQRIMASGAVADI